MEINVNPEYFDEPYRRLLNCTLRDQIIFGGSSSGKSFSVMSMVVIWCLEGRTNLVLRKVGATLTTSCWQEVINAIDTLGVSHLLEITPYKKQIISKVSSGSIMMRGCDDSDKIKSIRSLGKFAIDTIVCEESIEFSPKDLYQLRIRQRGISPFPKRFIKLLNPVMKTHHIYTEYFEPIGWEDEDTSYEDEEMLIIKTTYRDNTHLTGEDITTLEDFKETSPYHYQVFCLGSWGVLGSLVLDSVNFVDTLPEMQDFEWRAGLDAGYNDALTFVLSKVHGKTIHVVDCLSFRKLDDLQVYVDAVLGSLEKHGAPSNQLILADSSDPRLNVIVGKQGLNVKKAVKGKGSKLGGIMYMKSMRIYIPRNLNVLVNSIASYVWKEDKNGVTLDETHHTGSDEVDALRYSLELDMRSSRTTFGNM